MRGQRWATVKSLYLWFRKRNILHNFVKSRGVVLSFEVLLYLSFSRIVRGSWIESLPCCTQSRLGTEVKHCVGVLCTSQGAQASRPGNWITRRLEWTVYWSEWVPQRQIFWPIWKWALASSSTYLNWSGSSADIIFQEPWEVNGWAEAVAALLAIMLLHPFMRVHFALQDSFRREVTVGKQKAESWIPGPAW